ncbi:MAG: hypothetical protein NVS1B11_20310 [Terriglobales bacterium]
MATITQPGLESATSSIDRQELLSLMESEARLIGVSVENAISQIKSGKPDHGYIWDDLALLVALLAE